MSALAESYPFVSICHISNCFRITKLLSSTKSLLHLHHELAFLPHNPHPTFQFKECLKFQLNWLELLPTNWSGPIVVRSPSFMRSLRDLLLSHSNRVIHNSLLLLFALNALPNGASTPLICTKATVIEARDPAGVALELQLTN